MSAAPEIAPGAHIGAAAQVAEGVVVGPGAVIHDGARIAEGVLIGSGAVTHPGTELGEGCVVEDHAVLGKRPRLRASSNAPLDELGPLVLERGVTVCAGAVVYVGVRIGSRTIIGDQAHVRERAQIGNDSVLGRGSSVEYGAQIGSRVVIQSDAYVTAGMLIEDDVFIGPGVITTNDDTMGRHPRGDQVRAPTLRRGCRVGGGAVLAPGVVIGPEAFVAAGAVVTRDVGEREVVMGVPGRSVRRVPEHDLLERWRR